MSSTSTGLPAAPTVRRPRPGGWRGVRPWVMPIIGLVVAFAFLWPYLVMLLDAFRPSSDVVKTPPSLLPEQWKWTTFSEVLGDERFLAWLKSSLVISLSSTAIVVVVAIPAAYFTARFRFRGRMAFLFLVLVTQMFAPTSLVVGIYREFYALTLVDTYQALILTNAAFNLAFAIWILHGFFASIPREIEEAAELDGAGRLGRLWRVMLPLTLPGLVTATIFTFIAAWNEYVVALTLMLSDDKKPLTVGINSYVTGYEQNWDQLFAASIVAIVPVVVLFAVIEKHLVGGLTSGAVK
ncbi:MULTISPECIES: carbohydrate ABC transporter permease [unclassified Phycicoccus]|uniref:carbohydrate ABC transporter permease n=1 Tax=unclassified Phycicoccus TaxID=2637926 RepID=UPI00070240E6|nr:MULTISPECIES: carbohydrate ABC transporter permease [unclassified Phycicoccus]KRF25612.1 sugar ABC transporter permease [Phycicoccus sp. Soil803]KRF27774.1 sugar ABC transporter permease [Phycicoccus sp. Soil802]